tara:strand:+ start:405 stop:602 length:198 start_codon:yes stop_codon:yes gene_type:complete
MIKKKLTKKEDKFLPDKFRYLKVGEQLRENDYFWNESENKWVKILYDADTANWVEQHVIRERKNE